MTIHGGCNGVDLTEVKTIAESVLIATPACKAKAGEYVVGVIEGYSDEEELEGLWKSLY